MELKSEDYEQASKTLGCTVAAVKAVVTVESLSKGFVGVNMPSILFEGHVFWNQLKIRGINPEAFQKGNEDVLYPKWTKKYYKGGIKEYTRLNKASLINREAALSSASWGITQIMGYNYKICGCVSVEEFVKRQSTSEAEQLDLFVRFLKGNRWHIFLQKLDWKGFASHYNGPGYAANKYDVKLAKAYKQFYQ